MANEPYASFENPRFTGKNPAVTGHTGSTEQVESASEGYRTILNGTGAHSFRHDYPLAQVDGGTPTAQPDTRPHHGLYAARVSAEKTIIAGFKSTQDVQQN